MYDNTNNATNKPPAENGEVSMTTRTASRKRALRTPTVKAFSAGKSGVSAAELISNMMQPMQKLPGNVLAPPYDFKRLYDLFEASTLLRPCIDAYVTNIESFGHHLIPSIDFSAKESAAQISNAILYEQATADDATVAAELLPEPTVEAVEARRLALERVARFEYTKLEAFMSFCCPTMSFVELRRRTRQDLEVLGNAFWEVARNALGEIAYFYYANPIFMHLCVSDAEPVTVTEKVKVTDITWREVSYPYYFRRFARTGANDDAGVTRVIYFKEFGDPRIISRLTGNAYPDLDAMKAAEPEAVPATEILHFTIPTPASPYGVPRWIANLPGVLGSRELDTVNLNYFKNNVVPPLALLCSGGRFGKGIATRIEEFIEEHLKGKKGINRILVLEAEGQKAAGDSGPRTVPKLQFVPLRDVQQTDALFQNYDIRNEEKVAKSFRLPRIMRGDDSNTNRATAWASLKFVEEEVFEPEREAFDSIMNRRILPVLGTTFWIFRSNAPIVRDPEAMAEMVVNLVKVGVLTLGEGRDMCKDIFNRAFVEISEDWTGKPLPFLLAQLNLGQMTLNTPNGPMTVSTPNGRAQRDAPVSPAQPSVGDTPAGFGPPSPVVQRAGTPRGALGSFTESDAER